MGTKRSGESLLQVLMLNREILSEKNSKEMKQARSALAIIDLRGCDGIEKNLIKSVTQNSVLQGEFLYNEKGDANLTWMDASEIKPDSEYKPENLVNSSENPHQKSSDHRLVIKKLKSAQQSLMLEKELRKAAEKRNENMADELKRLRKENTNLQEDLAISYMSPPKG